MRDVSDIIERLCRLESDDLYVSKEDTERACKWMYGQIQSLQDTVYELRKQVRANEIGAADAKGAMPVLKEVRR